MMNNIKLYGVFVLGWFFGAYWMFKRCYPHLKEYFSNTTDNTEV